MTVKEYLIRYQAAYREAKDTELRITQLRLKYAAPGAIQYSDMPKAHNTEHDLSDYAAKLDGLTDQLVKNYSRCIGIEADILDRLTRMESQEEREVLRYRYIDGMKWEDIADCIPCNLRTVYKIHGRALMHFPKEGI